MAGSRADSRRKAGPRVGLEVLVTVIPEDGRAHLAQSRNLSGTGILVKIPETLAIGSQVQLKLFLPGTGNARFVATGEVIREGEPDGQDREYGVRFVEMPGEAAIAIERFLSGRANAKR